jgi:hypothetical protein
MAAAPAPNDDNIPKGGSGTPVDVSKQPKQPTPPPPSPCSHAGNMLPDPPALPAWNAMDELWRSPQTGAGVFVGNRLAAMDESSLTKHGIDTIVVCAGEQRRHHDDNPRFSYHTFLVANWAHDLVKFIPANANSLAAAANQDQAGETRSAFRTTARLCGEHSRHPTATATSAAVEAYFEPVFAVVDVALNRGASVLIHCMAGAHRAGTVGMAVVMRLAAVAPQRYAPYDDTLATARRRRPILEPDLVAQGTAVHLLRVLDGTGTINQAITSNSPAAALSGLRSETASSHPMVGSVAAATAPRAYLGGLFERGGASTDPIASMTHQMLRNLRAGVPRDEVVMAAVTRSGRPHEDIVSLLAAAEIAAP